MAVIGQARTPERTIKLTGNDGTGYCSWAEAHKWYDLASMSMIQRQRIFSSKGLDIMITGGDYPIKINLRIE